MTDVPTRRPTNVAAVHGGEAFDDLRMAELLAEYEGVELEVEAVRRQRDRGLERNCRRGRRRTRLRRAS